MHVSLLDVAANGGSFGDQADAPSRPQILEQATPDEGDEANTQTYSLVLDCNGPSSTTSLSAHQTSTPAVADLIPSASLTTSSSQSAV